VNVTPEQIRLMLLSVLVLVVSVAFHEFGHAKMADMLGDDTPRRQGRITLNPLAHADPIGTLLVPLIGGFYGVGLGWGRPVQWQPSRIHRKWRMTTAQILVALAGPSMNVVLACVGMIVHVILIRQSVMGPLVMSDGVLKATTEASFLLMAAVKTNFVLFFFNLLPLPPLDGGHVAQGLTPYRHRDTFDQIARFAPFVLLAIVAVPGSPLRQLFQVPATWCTQHIYSALFSLFGM
jgi:Zn-dependent protease